MIAIGRIRSVDNTNRSGILSAAVAKHQFIYSPSDTPQGPGGVILFEVICAG